MPANSTEKHLAKVTSIEDPENRGRIRVSCAALLGDEDSDLPMLVEPAHDWGWFYMPDIGEIVEIEVVTSSEHDESRGQASIDNLDVKWHSKRMYGNEEGDTPTPIHNDFTAENYGKKRGFATPFGHVLIFDDTESAPHIYLTFMKAKLEGGTAPAPADYTRIEIEPDGSFKIGMLDKHVFRLQSDGNLLTVTLDGAKHSMTLDANAPEFTVELDNQKFTMKLDGTALDVKLEGATLKVEGKDADAKLTIGDGAKHVAIVEALETFYTTLKGKLDAFDAHIHPTGVGPSGPPNPMIVADPWDSAINSTKISIPDA